MSEWSARQNPGPQFVSRCPLLIFSLCRLLLFLPFEGFLSCYASLRLEIRESQNLARLGGIRGRSVKC